MNSVVNVHWHAVIVSVDNGWPKFAFIIKNRLWLKSQQIQRITNLFLNTLELEIDTITVLLTVVSVAKFSEVTSFTFSLVYISNPFK